MKFPLLPAFLLSGLFFYSLPARAQRTPKLGIDGGVFFPSSSKTKSVFGSNFKSLGPGFGGVQVLERKIDADIDLLREGKNDNDATVVFAGAKLLFPLKRPVLDEKTVGFAPYGGFGLNVTYARVDAPLFGTDKSGFGFGASAILGASFGRRFFSEARARLTTSAADFNFSGTQIVLGARF